MSSNDNSNMTFVEDTCGYLRNSPSPYHASANLAELLESSGFQRLWETQEWNIKTNGKYFVVRNDTSLIAFQGAKDSYAAQGMRIVGAHLDSPCLKVNPSPLISKHGYQQVNVEVYGSALLRTWFDRDLSIAGRVFFKGQDGTIKHELVNLERPVAYIPSIAIHLEKQANTRQKIDPQKHLAPLIATSRDNGAENLNQLIVQQLGDGLNENDAESLLGFDLSFYDVSPPRIIGAEREFLASARIDNLVSCYAGLNALLEAESDNFCMLVCNDHEEVGSVSDSGAQGSFLASVLDRLIGRSPTVIRHSALLSADGAHGIHPNYPQKHDEQHAPVINAGVVLKVNANQRYATTGEMVSVARNICEKLEIPLQMFVSRNNIPCGTTIGPIVASEIGIKTFDMGIPQFAMHSIREIAGCADLISLKRVLKGFFDSDQVSVTN